MFVLSGVILFASTVVYSSVEDGKLDWNIVTTEEGRFVCYK